MRSRAVRRLAWVAVLALVCFGAALAEQSFVHTDDGCNVEIHCGACRLAVGTTGVISAAVTSPATVQTAAPLAPEARSQLREAARRESPSRAPPLA